MAFNRNTSYVDSPSFLQKEYEIISTCGTPLGKLLADKPTYFDDDCKLANDTPVRLRLLDNQPKFFSDSDDCPPPRKLSKASTECQTPDLKSSVLEDLSDNGNKTFDIIPFNCDITTTTSDHISFHEEHHTTCKILHVEEQLDGKTHPFHLEEKENIRQTDKVLILREEQEVKTQQLFKDNDNIQLLKDIEEHKNKVRLFELEHNEKIQVLEEQHKEELIAMKNALNRREDDLGVVISKKDRDINDLLGRLEESRNAREESEIHLALAIEALSREKEKALGLQNSIDEITCNQKSQVHIDDTKLRDMETELSRKDDQIKNLEENITMNNEICLVLRSQLKDSEVVIDYCKMESSSLKEEIEHFKEMKNRAELESKALTDEITGLKEENIQCQNELESTRGRHEDVDSVRSELLQQQQKVEELERTIDEYYKANAELKIDARINARSTKELRDQVARKQEKIKQLESDISDLKEECSLFEGQLKNSSKVIAQAKQETHQLAKEIGQLKNEMTIKNVESNALLIEIGRLKETNEHLQRELSEFRHVREKLTIVEEELVRQNENAKVREKTIKENYEVQAGLSVEVRVNSSKVKDLEVELKGKVEKIKQLQSNVNKLKEACSILEGQLQDFEVAIVQKNEESSSWKVQAEQLKSLVISSRGESNTFLSQIVKLKEANTQLTNEQVDVSAKHEEAKEEVLMLNEQLETVTAEKAEAEHHLKSLIDQKSSLIENLQAQLDQLQAKKNRGFVERIFGSDHHSTSDSNKGSPSSSSPVFKSTPKNYTGSPFSPSKKTKCCTLPPKI